MDVGVFDFRSTSGLVGAVKAVEEGAAVLALLPRDIWRWFIAHAREWRAAETNAETSRAHKHRVRRGAHRATAL